MRDMKPRLEIRLFAAAMEKRLQENDHKGGWGDETLRWLLGRLRDELAELEHAAGLGCRSCRRGKTKSIDPVRVLHEATDVANFAMMVAQNAESS